MDAEALRQQLVDDNVIPGGVSDERVIAAMQAVPRHLFVPAQYQDSAYMDTALPIGFEQTISQPTLVGLMTQSLEIQPTDRVLEIGTGSGYQAAILSELASKVYTIERIPKLAKKARRLLKKLRYSNIEVIEGDGSKGCEKAAPFDAILVTAAADRTPAVLEDQLKDGGRIVIPVRKHNYWQELQIGIKRNVLVSYRQSHSVVFVPLIEENDQDLLNS